MPQTNKIHRMNLKKMAFLKQWDLFLEAWDKVCRMPIEIPRLVPRSVMKQPVGEEIVMLIILRRLLLIFTVLWCAFNLSIYLAIPLLIITEWYFEFGNDFAKERIEQHKLSNMQKAILNEEFQENMKRAVAKQKRDRIIETAEYLARYMPKI